MYEPNALTTYRKRSREPFPNLRSLMDGWFHQDYDIDGPDLETIIPKFVSVTRRIDVEGTIYDIGMLLHLYGKDDQTLCDAVERILNPGVILEGWEGMTTREWLVRVAELLQVELVPRPFVKP